MVYSIIIGAAIGGFLYSWWQFDIVTALILEGFGITIGGLTFGGLILLKMFVKFSINLIVFAFKPVIAVALVVVPIALPKLPTLAKWLPQGTQQVIKASGPAAGALAAAGGATVIKQAAKGQIIRRIVGNIEMKWIGSQGLFHLGKFGEHLAFKHIISQYTREGWKILPGKYKKDFGFDHVLVKGREVILFETKHSSRPHKEFEILSTLGIKKRAQKLIQSSDPQRKATGRVIIQALNDNTLTRKHIAVNDEARRINVYSVNDFGKVTALDKKRSKNLTADEFLRACKIEKYRPALKCQEISAKISNPQ